MRIALRVLLAAETLAVEGLLLWLAILAGSWRDEIPGAPLIAFVPASICVIAAVGLIVWPMFLLVRYGDT